MTGSMLRKRVFLELRTDGDGWLATAPKLCVGDVEIRGTAERATELTAYYGEDLKQAQRRKPYTGWVDPLRDSATVGPGPFVMRGPARRSVRAVSIAPNPALRIESVVVEHAHFQGPNPGRFACDDVEVNELWEIAAHTIRCCSQEFLEDGPCRDGMCWIGDCAVAGPAALLVVDGAYLLKRSLSMFLELARPDGSLPANAVRAGGHRLDRLPYLRANPQGPLGEWTLANYVADYAIAIRDYVHWTGDAGMRQDCREVVQKAGLWCVGTLSRLAEGADTGDYITDNDGSPDGPWWRSPGTLACQLYGGVAVGAGLTGDADLAAALEQCGGFVKPYRAANGGFSDEPDGPPSRHATSAGVLAELTNAAHDLFDDRHYAQARPLVSGYAASQWLAAIARSGDTGLVLDHLRRWWGPMRAAGSSTAWERLDPRDGSYPRPDGAPVSQCHAWSGAPAALLPLKILGIECRAPGWDTLRIAPRLGPLRWAEAAVPTPHGLIEVRAERNEKSGAVAVEKVLPSGCREERGY